jgi:glucose-1-phosphate cytidylyltransferase
MIKGLLEKIAKEGEMKAFRHCNFWWPMDTMRDKNTLEWMWDNGHAPWKVLK